MKRFKTAFFALLALAVTAGVAYASGGEAGEHGGGHGPNYWDFIFRLINFVLFVGIVYKFAGKKIAGFFGGRRAQIKNELDDLDARRKAAEANLREVEQRIRNIDQEREAITAEFVRQGEALKGQIVQEAEQKAARILEQAESAAAIERKIAMEGLKAEMADMIVGAAEQMLKDKLSDADHQKLVDDYLTKVVLN